MFCSLQRYSLAVDEKLLKPEAFRKQYLVPLCGEKASAKAMQQLLYQVAASYENTRTRERLERIDGLGFKYICFEMPPIYIKARCYYADDFCKINIIEYGTMVDFPP